MTKELESIKNNLCSIMQIHSVDKITAVQMNITGVDDLLFVDNNLSKTEYSDILFRIKYAYNEISEECWKIASMEFLHARGYKYGRNDFNGQSYYITMATIISLVLAKQLDYGIKRPAKSYLKFETKRKLLTFIRTYANKIDLLSELEIKMFKE